MVCRGIRGVSEVLKKLGLLKAGTGGATRKLEWTLDRAFAVSRGSVVWT